MSSEEECLSLDEEPEPIDDDDVIARQLTVRNRDAVFAAIVDAGFTEVPYSRLAASGLRGARRFLTDLLRSSSSETVTTICQLLSGPAISLDMCSEQIQSSTPTILPQESSHIGMIPSKPSIVATESMPVRSPSGSVRRQRLAPPRR